MSGWKRLNELLFRLASRFYPGSVRKLPAEEIRAVFRDRWEREHRRRGWMGWFRTWHVVAGDLITSYTDESTMRTAKQTRFMGGWATDFKTAVRGLLRRPLFSSAVVASLAVGIGANSAVFSVLEQLVLHPIPIDGADRAVYIAQRNERTGFQVSPRGFQIEAWKEQATAFEIFETYRPVNRLVAGIKEPAYEATTAVAPTFFNSLGIGAVVGRVIRPSDGLPDAPRVAVMSRAYWRSEFGSDSDVVGASVLLNDTAYTIVGVLAEDLPLGFLPSGGFWTPSRIDRLESAHVLARLEAGVTPEQAQQQLRAIPVDQELTRPGWQPSVSRIELFASSIRSNLWILFGGVALLLLIACANVANMFLARGADRWQEFSVRAALGGSRWTLVRMLLMEGMVAAVASGVVGLALAYLILQGIVAIRPERMWALQYLELDRTTLAVNFGFALLTGLIFGVAPAARLSRAGITDSLRLGHRSGSVGASHGSLRNAIVALQVALALVVFVGAGLMTRSFAGLRTADPGFEPEGVALLEVRLPETRYSDEARRATFWRSLRDELVTIPGIERLSIASGMPTRFGVVFGALEVEGADASPQDIEASSGNSVSVGYFDVVGTSIVAGRAFVESDQEDPGHVVIVNREFASRMWGSPAAALGNRIRFSSSERWRTVVGVTEDVRAIGMEGDRGWPQLYMLATEWNWASAHLLIRFEGGFEQVRIAIEHAVRYLDAAVPINNLTEADAVIAAAVANERFATALFGILAAIAMLLATLGIYGVVTLAVTHRVSELGIRIALGATRRNVLGSVIARALAPVTIGMVLGIAGAFVATRLLEGSLHGISTSDPVTYVGVSAWLFVLALVAAGIPAARATRIDPVSVMRVQ